jgi:4-amino-4-deoxy-L-arabinose transferase-like glycosyltransferase
MSSEATNGEATNDLADGTVYPRDGRAACWQPGGGLAESLGANVRLATRDVEAHPRAWLTWFIWLAWAGLLKAHLATIGHVPAGLHYDEAYNALDALRIGSDGYWPAFLQGNFGREPLMVYIMAACLHLFGSSVWAVRLPGVLAWAAALPALYWLIRELHPSRQHAQTVRWAIAAPLFMTSLWFGITAHYAIRSSWFLLTQMLFLAALLRVWNTGRLRVAVLAGFLGGLCFYTYLPSRLLPLLLVVILALVLARRRDRLLARWRVLAVVVLVAMVVLLPLAAHFVRFPTDLYQRISQVAVPAAQDVSGEATRLAGLLDNGKRVVDMFFVHGDESPRNNIPERPLLTWWILPLFLLGLLASLRRRKGFRRLFLLLWFLIMLLPTWLSQDAPSFQRASGAFSPLCLLLAEGGYALWQWVQPAGSEARGSARLRSRLGRPAAGAALVTMVVVQSGLSLWAFQQWATQPEQFYAFDEGITQIGQYVGQLPPEQLVYLSPLQDHPTLTFTLATEHDPPPVHSFDGRHVLVFRPGADALYVVVTHEDWHFESIASWLYQGQELQPEQTYTDREGKAYAKVFRLPPAAQARTPQFPKIVAWQDGVHLEGYDLIPCCSYQAGDRIYVELWWTVGVEPPDETWTVFVHLVAPDGSLVAQGDAEPGYGSYPTDRWQPGEVIIDEHELLIPDGSPPGEYALEIGLYNWRTGERLGLADGSADSVSLQEITVEASP